MIVRDMARIGAIGLVICLLASEANAQSLPVDTELRERDFYEQEAGVWLKTDSLDRSLDVLPVFRKGKPLTSGGYWYLSTVYEGYEQAIYTADTSSDVEELVSHMHAWALKHRDEPASVIGASVVDLGRANRDLGEATDTVAGKVLYRTRLDAIRASLEQAKELASVDPHWYAMLTRVMIAQRLPKAA
jgi:hypothetical protein